MQSTLTNLLCPLCKRPIAPASNQASQQTRLCPDCQSIVHTIAPKDTVVLQAADNDPRSEESAKRLEDFKFEVAVNGVQPPGITVQPATVVFETPETAPGNQFGYVPESRPDFKLTTQPLTGERAPTEPGQMANQTGTHDSPRPPDISPRQAPASTKTDVEFHTQQQANMQSTVSLKSSNAGQSGELETAPGPVQRRVGARSESGRLLELAQALSSASTSSSTSSDSGLSELAEAAGMRRNSGPIEVKPPPASHSPAPPVWAPSNQYPVLMSSSEPVSWTRRLRWPAAILLLLGALGTAGYLIGFQKWLTKTPGGPTQSTATGAGKPESGQSSTNPAGLSPSPTPIAPSQRVETTPPVAAQPERTESPSPVAAASGAEANSAQARYSLQAASFPSESAANGFSEKLVRAGIPAYVIGVEIPHRGKWFRVRAGRFATAEEAAKYAAQCRLRAKASGMAVDFIVCDFEKP